MFIDYNKKQLTFPLDVEVHIPEHHPSRVVHTAVEAMDFFILLSLKNDVESLIYMPTQKESILL
ncbi:Uncharacterised protein [Streptococcus pneumoniae]|nr:hypothetical protein A9523_25375 [Bacillus cereus]CKG72606.1 Uncharacterised protein [Streptococcus pneumoniae]COF53774.1 Uncharacterised protein [Streptococcus pneumoniae]COQ28549.1 Uncharacterised protein [Streptococcus pneumoniae]COS18061.1 Uncharacterised protein [Streptococcus pneumoniae]